MTFSQTNLGRKFLSIALILSALSLTAQGCSAQPQDPIAPQPSQPSTFNTSEKIAVKPSNSQGKEEAIVNPGSEKFQMGQSKFGLDLFSALYKQNPKRNLFISPVSISQAIAMLYNGAAGETYSQMGSVMGAKDLELKTFNEAHENWREALEYPDSNVQLSIANSIWTNKQIGIKPNFLSQNQRYYKAKAESLDFGDRQSIKTINNWVERNTQGKIKGIVDNLDPSQLLILINATYFKGEWSKAFDPKLTTAQLFKGSEGNKPVQMMKQRGNYRYFETEELQAIVLPYGNAKATQESGSRLNLYVILPKEGNSIASLLEQFPESSGNLMQKITQNSQKNQGSIQLPRFKIESDLTLNDSLTAIGMGGIFSGTANFKNLSDKPTRVDTVKHKTFVEVNEEGTEAAAVTSIGIRSTSVERVKPPFEMKVDRPFLCILRDDRTGAVLFMGAIVNP